MKTGDLVIAPFNPQEVEPRLYQILAITRGKAELRRIGITDGVMTPESTRIDIYTLRSWRFLDPAQADSLRSTVIDLRRKHAEVRNAVGKLPLVADV